MKEKLEDIGTWCKYRIYYPWLDFKRGIKNLVKFFPVIWKTNDWDWRTIIDVQKFQLERLLKSIKEGNEIDETRIPKEKDIERCLELINNLIEDNYAERCGYDSERHIMGFKPLPNGNYEMVNNHPNPQTDEELSVIFKNSRELEKKEWDELWDIIKKGKEGEWGLNSWWV